MPTVGRDILLGSIQQMLHACNPYVCVFQRAGQILHNQPSVDLTMTIKTDVSGRDPRHYTTDQQPMKSSSLCPVTAAKMSAVAILFHAVDKALYSVSVRPPAAAMIRCIMLNYHSDTHHCASRRVHIRPVAVCSRTASVDCFMCMSHVDAQGSAWRYRPI